MREIEFRGKYSNKWIYGYLIKNVDDNKFYITVSTDQFYQVKENTIGQYTGLKDKNGKKIFEGDIVQYPDECPYTVMFDPTGYWCLDGNGIRNSEMLIQYDDTNDYIEVIGNIYEDNLESEVN